MPKKGACHSRSYQALPHALNERSQHAPMGAQLKRCHSLEVVISVGQSVSATQSLLLCFQISGRLVSLVKRKQEE
jgi:hypothetical protein